MKTAVIQQDTCPLSKSHAGTSDDIGSMATRRTQKSGSKDPKPRRLTSYEPAPHPLYTPKAPWGKALWPERPHGPSPRETEHQRALRLRQAARDRNRPAFNQHDRATGVYDARNTINALCSTAAAPSTIYPAYFIDEIVLYRFPPSFKINMVALLQDRLVVAGGKRPSVAGGADRGSRHC